MIIAQIKTTISAAFSLTVLDGKTGKVKRHIPMQKNLILNAALDAIGNGTDIYTTVAVGTGNTTPATTDTALDNQIAYTSTLVDIPAVTRTTTAPFYVERTNTWQFAQGAAQGALKEIGLSSYGSTLWTRALITDGAGTPITLDVGADEILNVTYILRFYKPYGESDLSGSFTVTTDPGESGESSAVHNYTLRMANAGTAGNPEPVKSNSSSCAGYDTYTLGAVTGAGSGTGYTSASGRALQSYTNGTYYRDIDFTFVLSQANYTIEGLYLGLQPSGGFQIKLTDVITKSNTQTLKLTFRQSWARHP